MRDFQNYGRLEAANIIFVPAFAFFLAPPQNELEIVVLVLAMLACASFLYIGARYWLALDKHIRQSNTHAMARALQLADLAEKPFLGLTILSVLTALAGLLALGWTAAVIAALVLTILASLEYVNYYHYQLMNFDQLSDFKRLIRTRRLRRAHLARKLSTFRKRRRT